MKLKDTLTQKLQPVTGNQQKIVKIYSCGPTVYDYPHLGNWYAFLRWDLLVRTLRINGFKTLWVMNITDVGHLVSDADDGEDKLVKKALKEKKTAYDIANYYTDYFLKALKRLNFSTPNHLPKATEHITEQIDLIVRLQDQGLTYMVDDGLYYDTSKLADYGKLIHLKSLKQDFKARIKTNDQKRNPTDFALWKLTPPGQKRDMQWESPWGIGFPGWHLECSAMCWHYLKAPVDIHAGGIDHIAIHHTNELAQSEPAYKKPMAKIWLHSNFITVDKVKMSKSLNNFYTLEDIEKKGYDLRSLRLAVFSTRYSNLADFNWSLLKQAQLKLEKLIHLSGRLFQLQSDVRDELKDKKLLKTTIMKIKKALSDDLNSPLALEQLDFICHKLNAKPLSLNLKSDLKNFIKTIDNIFGLNLITVEDLNAEQKKTLKQRQKARDRKDFKQSDLLRDQLLKDNIKILDTEFGQIWHKTISF